MAVEKALVEEREGFFTGGRSRRGGLRGGRRSSKKGKGPKKGGPRGRGLKRTRDFKKTAKGKAAVARGRQKAAERQGFGQFARRQKNIIANKTVTPQQAAVSAAPEAVKGLPDARDIAKVDTSFGDERDAFNKATGFQTTGGGFLTNQGNIVRSKTQVDRFREEKARERALRGLFANQIQAEEAKRVTPTFSGLQNRLAQVRNELGKGKQTPENLRRLVDINRRLGDFDYAGMGLGNQFRTQGADLVAGIPGLAKVASAIAGGPAGIASLVATGGRGITGLIADRLGFGKGDEDSRPTMADVSNQEPESGLQSLLAGLRIGEGAPFVAERGGRQDERGRTAMLPPVLPPAPAVQQVAQAAPITGQPVDSNILNQYLALAGFSPQEIQGFAPDIRFI